MNKSTIISEVNKVQLLANEVVLVAFLEKNVPQRVLFTLPLIDAYSIYSETTKIGGIKVGDYIFDSLVLDFDVQKSATQFLDVGNGMFLNKSQIISIEDSIMQIKLPNTEGKLFFETKDVNCFNIETSSGLIRLHDEVSMGKVKEYLDVEFKESQYYESAIQKDLLSELLNDFVSDDKKLEEVIFIKDNKASVEVNSVSEYHRKTRKKYFTVSNNKTNVYEPFDKIYSLIESKDLLGVADIYNISAIKGISKNRI